MTLAHCCGSSARMHELWCPGRHCPFQHALQDPASPVAGAHAPPRAACGDVPGRRSLPQAS
eukprot:7475643-Pyramimonas_sp.AAC.1